LIAAGELDDPSVAVQRPDVDLLRPARGEPAHLAHVCHDAVRLGARDLSDVDVLGDRQVRGQRKLLVDDADAEAVGRCKLPARLRWRFPSEARRNY